MAKTKKKEPITARLVLIKTGGTWNGVAINIDDHPHRDGFIIATAKGDNTNETIGSLVYELLSKESYKGVLIKSVATEWSAFERDDPL